MQLPNYYRVPDLKTDSPARVCALVNVYLVSTLIDGLGGVRARVCTCLAIGAHK